MARRPEPDVPMTRDELADFAEAVPNDERECDPELLSRCLSPVPIRESCADR